MAVSETVTGAGRGRRRAPAPDNCRDVLVALRRIIRATDRHSKRLARETGLTIPQIVVMQSVRELGEVTTGEISERVSLSQGTVTTVLDRLEERGLVERYRSAADRRVVHTRLTPAGEAARRKAPPLLQEHFQARFASLPAGRQREIVSALQAVAGMMGVGDVDAAPLLDVDPPMRATRR